MNRLERFLFYIDRIKAAPNYGFVAGHEILAVVCDCAKDDSNLTDDDRMIIVNYALKIHIKMMEDNFNGNW